MEFLTILPTVQALILDHRQTDGWTEGDNLRLRHPFFNLRKTVENSDSSSIHSYETLTKNQECILLQNWKANHLCIYIIVNIPLPFVELKVCTVGNQALRVPPRTLYRPSYPFSFISHVNVLRFIFRPQMKQVHVHRSFLNLLVPHIWIALRTAGDY